MTKKIIWRLADKPTVASLESAVTARLLTKEEAREILFSHEDIEEKKPSVKGLETEIEFLRKLVEQLSHGSATRIVETIRIIAEPYRTYPFYQPYYAWCNTAQAGAVTGGVNSVQTHAFNNSAGIAVGGASSNLANTQASGIATGSAAIGFSKIKTF